MNIEQTGKRDDTTAEKAGGLSRIPTEAMLNAARDWSVKKYGIGIGNDAATGCWESMHDARPTAVMAGGLSHHIPGNFTTHRTAWGTALEESRDRSVTEDAAAYWKHAIAAYNRAFARLLDNPEPVRPPAMGADSLPPEAEVQATEAKLCRDLTGDAMALGYDGVPAALEALRQPASGAVDLSDRPTKRKCGGQPNPDGELMDDAARACGMYLDGPEPWNPLTNEKQAQLLVERLGLKVELPKYKGFGTTCGKFTVFLEDADAQTRRAIVMAAAEVYRSTANGAGDLKGGKP